MGQDVGHFEAFLHIAPSLLPMTGEAIDPCRLAVLCQLGAARGKRLALAVALRAVPGGLSTQARGTLRAATAHSFFRRRLALHTYFKRFSAADLIRAMRALRLCNVDPANDRGSHRMRLVAVALVSLLQTLHRQLELMGALLTKAAALPMSPVGLRCASCCGSALAARASRIGAARDRHDGPMAACPLHCDRSFLLLSRWGALRRLAAQAIGEVPLADALLQSGACQ